MSIKETLFLGMVLLTLVAVGCEKGPAEKMGEKVDTMVKNTGNEIEDLCEDVKEGMKSENPDC